MVGLVALLGMGLCGLFGVWATDVGGDNRPFMLLLLVFGLVVFVDGKGR